MSDNATLQNPEFKAAFLAHERQVRLNTGKVASVLVSILVMAGVSLDWVVYPDLLGTFLILRLLCSAFVAVIFFLHLTQFGQKY